MALGRVQSTGLVRSGSTASITLTFPAPPTVGNAILIATMQWGGGVPSAIDNRGNTYLLGPTIIQSGIERPSVLYCSQIAATGSPFTITVSGSGYWSAVAIEVSGVGGGLVLDQSAALGSAPSTAPTTGVTAALSAAEVILMAALSIQSGQASITVQAVSPAWVEEAEDLAGSWSPGEADSRILTSALGTTQSCSWTLASSVEWAAVVAAFKATAAGVTPTRVTQDAVELLSLPILPSARLTQAVLETLSSVVAPVPSTPRITQDVIELLSANPPAPTPARVTQLSVDVLRSVVVGALTTQLAVEVFAPPLVPVRLTQAAVELFDRHPGLAFNTQLVVEIFLRLPPCTTGEFPIDDLTTLVEVRRRRREWP